MPQTHVWQDQYQIHSYEVDITARATMPFICQFMQESAWHHAEHLGVGFGQLAAQNLAWVLSRQRVVMDAYPRWGDTITIRTWAAGKSRLFWLRDFLILDEQGELLGRATTSWIVIDLTQRKPQRANSITLNLQLDSVERAFSNEPDKIEPLTNGKLQQTIQVTYSDVDVNQHVNNVRYIEWLLNAFDLAFHQTHHLAELDINYMAEAGYGDTLTVVQQSGAPLVFGHSLTRPTDHTELCRARTRWQKSA